MDGKNVEGVGEHLEDDYEDGDGDDGKDNDVNDDGVDDDDEGGGGGLQGLRDQRGRGYHQHTLLHSSHRDLKNISNNDLNGDVDDFKTI